MKKLHVVVLMLALTVTSVRAADSSAYLTALRTQINASEKQIPTMTMAAEEAARRVLAGGKMWVAGTQPEFSSEPVDRAGGLKLIDRLAKAQPSARDVVLFGIREWNDAARANVRHWASAGTQVILFGHLSDSTPLPKANATLIDCGATPGVRVGEKLCPTDTVTNIANLWAFTGEFIAACTRSGKMPVILESYWLPGGRERDQKYSKALFHDDMNIAPISPSVLAKDYLDDVQRSLEAIERENPKTFQEVGAWVAHAGPKLTTIQIIGHMYPSHCRDPRAPGIADTIVGEGAKVIPTPVVLHIGYQTPPTSLLREQAKAHFKFFYSAVDLGPTVQSKDLVRMDPHWPVEDGCVKIEGYDVPALAESGVINAAIYWSIVQDSTTNRPASK
jgi:hypothetical protein